MKLTYHLLTISLFLIFSSRLVAKEIKVQGIAKNANKTIVYTENHTNPSDKKLNVSYVNPSTNKEFGKLQIDFKNSPYLPDSKFEKSETGFKEEALFDSNKNKVVVKFTLNKSTETKTKIFNVLKNQKDLLTVHGLNHFLLDNFDALAKDSSVVKFKLLVPSKLEIYEFKVYQTSKNKKEVTFTLEIDNWLYRIFAPALNLSYSLPERRFIRFKGVSNLVPEKENGEEVTVEFSYL